MAGDTVKTKKKWEIKKELYTCFLGMAFASSAFRAVLDLQTSINIQDGLGSTAGFVMSGAAILGSVTIAPVVLRRLGAKKCLILCDIFYFTFILANFYPVFGTMIPGGFFGGLADAILFPSLSLFNVFYAKQYSKHAGNHTMQHYLRNFAGKCFGVVYLARVAGNLMSFAILQIPSNEQNQVNSSLEETVLNETIHNADYSFQFCGANDCQDPNVTEKDLSRYVAPKTTTYTLLSIFTTFTIIAVLVHWLAVREINSLDENANGGKELMHKEVEPWDTGVSRHEPNICSLITDTLKKCSRQIVNPYQLLLMGSQFYAGLQLAFVTAEVSRAYVSCILNVGQVGLALAIFASVGGASSYLNGLLSARFGKNIPLICSTVVDIIVYIFCLTWEPNDSNRWVVYIICAVLGYSSGIWQCMTNAVCAKYFVQDQEVAFSVWGMFFSAGMTLQYGWSIHLCVRTKIYASGVILCSSMILYGIAEVLRHKKARVMKSRPSAKELLENYKESANS